jgi:hypothetical protein
MPVKQGTCETSPCAVGRGPTLIAHALVSSAPRSAIEASTSQLDIKDTGSARLAVAARAEKRRSLASASEPLFGASSRPRPDHSREVQQ